MIIQLQDWKMSGELSRRANGFQKITRSADDFETKKVFFSEMTVVSLTTKYRRCI
jgi:hypothetical protein